MFLLFVKSARSFVLFFFFFSGKPNSAWVMTISVVKRTGNNAVVVNEAPDDEKSGPRVSLISRRMYKSDEFSMTGTFEYSAVAGSTDVLADRKVEEEVMGPDDQDLPEPPDDPRVQCERHVEGPAGGLHVSSERESLQELYIELRFECQGAYQRASG